MHKLLERQLKKGLGAESDGQLARLLEGIAELGAQPGVSAEITAACAGLGQLLSKVDLAYEQFDRDLSLRARSLELSSAELAAANEKLRRESAGQAKAIASLREAANSLLRRDGKPELGEDSATLELLSDLMAAFMGEREAAKAELERHKFAVDQHAIVSITDADGTILYANDRFCEISGYRRDELVGQNHRIIKSGVHPTSYFTGMWAMLARGRVWHGEVCNRTKTGVLYWVSATIVPLVDERGVPERYIAIRTDITHQKALEVELRTRREFLQSITNAMGEGVFVMDAAGFCTFMNPEAQRVLGWSVADLAATPMHDAVHARDASGARFPIAECPTAALIATGETYRSDDDYYIRRDGTVFPVSVVSVPMREAGRTVGTVTVFQDITTRRQTVEALVAAKEEADRASRLKSDFLANMSHEIRTPMNAVIGLNHLLSKTPLAPRQRDYSTKIDTASRGLLRIINDILDFSKIEAGKLTVEQVDFLVADVIHEVAGVVGPRAREKGLELIVDQASDLPAWLSGDPLRVGQVLLNLVANAVKFTEAGTVTLRVGASVIEPGLVRLEASVTDTGIGLSAGQVAGLFKAFTQADTSTTRRFGGTGLGLAICKQLVELMGGEIQARSEVGQGSVFSFWVPCSVVAEVAEAPTLPTHLQGRRALVLDDSEPVLAILSSMLGRLGLTVETASSGAAAIERVEATRTEGAPSFDLILLDWRMPDMDGIETLRRIKAHTSPSPAVLMMTSYGADGLHAALGDLTVSAVLEKPISPSTLLDAVMDALDAPRAAVSAPAPAIDGTTALLAGGRVLLVEDNPVNQQVARGLLELLGADVTIAGDGQAALDRVREGSFHAILMDVQMPRMDGLEAAARIRSELGVADVPIIAMTAHAMAGDRVRSLAAGMNDHLTKPIDPEALQAALVRWMLPRLAGAKRGSSTRPSHPSSRPRIAVAPRVSHSALTLLEIPGIDLALARRHVSDNLNLLRRVLVDFSRSQPADLDRLREAVAAGDRATVLRVAHTLKGTASTVGAMEVARLAEQVEALVLAGGGERVASLVDALEEKLDVVVGAVTALLAPRADTQLDAAPGEGAEVVPDAARTRAALDLARRLRGLVGDADPGAGDLAVELAGLLAKTKLAAVAAAVARHAGNFDFEDAGKALAPLSVTLEQLRDGQP